MQCSAQLKNVLWNIKPEPYDQTDGKLYKE